MIKYNKLEDMLNGETPYEFARGVYKGVGCGPWISYVLKNGKDVYYGDAPKKIKNCVGVKIGSIVEGSDVEIGPETLMFPFTDEELWETISNINEEASFYWDRDNTDNYQIFNKGKEVGLVSWTAFDTEPKWEVFIGKIPKPIKDKLVKWYNKGRFVNGSCIIPEDKTWEFTKGWKCVEYINDITF